MDISLDYACLASTKISYDEHLIQVLLFPWCLHIIKTRKTFCQLRDEKPRLVHITRNSSVHMCFTLVPPLSIFTHHESSSTKTVPPAITLAAFFYSIERTPTYSPLTEQRCKNSKGHYYTPDNSTLPTEQHKHCTISVRSHVNHGTIEKEGVPQQQ